MHITLTIAKLEMARRMMIASKLRKEFNNKNPHGVDQKVEPKFNTSEIGSGCGNGLEVPCIEWTDEQREQLDKADRDVKRWGDVLNSMPQFSPLMSSWMFDVHGTDKTITVDKAVECLMDSLTSKNSAHVMVERLGNLQKLIACFIKENGFVISDSGGGMGKWHLGVRGTTGEIGMLCALLWNQFGFLVEEGVVYMECHYWGSRFADLYNDDSVLIFIDRHRDEYEKYCADPDPVWSQI